MPSLSEPDYFDNLTATHRWPFSIYHQPIEDAVVQACQALPPGARCLNIGCGVFASYPRLREALRWYACDVDARCLELVSANHPEVEVSVCGELPDYPADRFDFIMATEVIEHLSDARAWLARLALIAKPTARILLSTPNYGLSLLPILEYSILEIIARRRGFSRIGLHVNKYTRGKLARELSEAFPALQTGVRKTAYGMVLLGEVGPGVSTQTR